MPMKHASTGPRSAEGKARSSMNALKSGIYSKSLVIPGENRADLDALSGEYYQRFQPRLPEQRDLVDILVRATWTLRRLAYAEAQVWSYKMDRALESCENAPLGWVFTNFDQTLTRLQRIVNSVQRNYRDALRQLERSEPTPKPDPVAVLAPDPQPTEPKPVTPSEEFVSSTSAPPPPAPPKSPRKAPISGTDDRFSSSVTVPWNLQHSPAASEPDNPVQVR